MKISKILILLCALMLMATAVSAIQVSLKVGQNVALDGTGQVKMELSSVSARYAAVNVNGVMGTVPLGATSVINGVSVTVSTIGIRVPPEDSSAVLTLEITSTVQPQLPDYTEEMFLKYPKKEINGVNVALAESSGTRTKSYSGVYTSIAAADRSAALIINRGMELEVFKVNVPKVIGGYNILLQDVSNNSVTVSVNGVAGTIKIPPPKPKPQGFPPGYENVIRSTLTEEEGNKNVIDYIVSGGTQHKLNVGESVEFGGKTVKLVSVSATKACASCYLQAVVQVDDKSGSINAGDEAEKQYINAGIVNGINIAVLSIGGNAALLALMVEGKPITEEPITILMSPSSGGEPEKMIRFGGKDIRMVSVSTTKAVIDINGLTDSISLGATRTINGIDVTVDLIDIRVPPEDSFATLTFKLVSVTEEQPTPLETEGICGDDICDDSEDSYSCPDDCEGAASSGETETPTTLGTPQTCTSGCVYKGSCVPYGMRKAGQYCDTDNQLKGQKTEKSTCDNSFECDSNVCAGGTCISVGLIQRVINWLTSVFG